MKQGQSKTKSQLDSVSVCRVKSDAATEHGSAAARLLGAAAESFAERGFHGTTTREIAERAGLSSAALYVHFSSKEQLLFELGKQAHMSLLSLLTNATASSLAPAEQLDRVMGAFVDFHARHRDAARVANYEMVSLSRNHLSEIHRLRARIDEIFDTIIAAGELTGDFIVDDAGVARRAITSLGIDVARWYRPSTQQSLESFIIDYTKVGLRIVGVQESVR